MFEQYASQSRRRRPRAGERARFIEERAGSTMVEFALVALPTFLLILAIIEIGYSNFLQSRMDAAVRQTGRLILTGFVQDQKSGGKPLTAQQFRDQILCPKLPATMSCADVFVNVKVFSETEAAKSSPFASFINAKGDGLAPPALDNTQNKYCIGNGKEYVVLQAAYPLPLLTTVFLNANPMTYKGKPSRLMQSVTAFKNEPFPDGAAKPAGC